MDWQDQGTLLSSQRHGETAAIIDVFTQGHGRHSGVVRGGASRRLAPVLQPGQQLTLEWRARLESHIGTYRVEPLAARAASLLADRHALAALNAICSLLKFALPERQPHERLYDGTQELLESLTTGGDWPARYLLWELLLLESLGFGLDLESCAVTGTDDDLCYVSPKSGRAVSRQAAGDWADRLLPFPHPSSAAGISRGLRTTGYFLEHWLAPAIGDKPLPQARARFVNLMERRDK